MTCAAILRDALALQAKAPQDEGSRSLRRFKQFQPSSWGARAQRGRLEGRPHA